MDEFLFTLYLAMTLPSAAWAFWVARKDGQHKTVEAVSFVLFTAFAWPLVLLMLACFLFLKVTFSAWREFFD